MVSLGSSLSVQSFSRVGSYLSVAGESRLSGGGELRGNWVVPSGSTLTISGTLDILDIGDLQCEEGVSNTLCASTSDARLKKDVETLESYLEQTTFRLGADLSSVSAIEAVTRKLNPVKYRFKNKKKFGDYSYFGFIAQDLETALPELVRRKSNGELGLVYQNFAAILVAAVKDIYSRLDDSANVRRDAP